MTETRIPTDTATAPLLDTPQVPLDELVEVLPRLLTEPGVVLADLARRHGPVLRLAVAGTEIDVLVVAEPDVAREVLVDRDGVLVKGPGLQVTRVLLGDGLLTSEGADHARQRRMLAPAFQRPRLARYAAGMAEAAATHMEGWPTGEVVDAHALMVELMLDIVGRALFGLDLRQQAPEVGSALDDVLAVFAAQTPLGQAVGSETTAADQARAESAMAPLQALVLELIAARRAAVDGEADLLSALIAARDDDESALDDAEVHDQVMTLLLAGHETTANAVSWAIHLCSARPEVCARAAAEVDTIVGHDAVGYDDLDRLPWVRAVLDETLRHRPPAWIVTRQATAPTRFGGHLVPAGGQVMVSPWLLHHDPRVWPEPDGFRPERWTDSAADGERPRFAFAAFGGGARSCIGEHFARIEATIVLAELFRRFTMSPATDAPVEPEWTITLRPRGGVPVVLEPRR